MTAVPPWRGVAGRWRTLAKEISAFGVVGAINVLVDLAVFQLAYVAWGFGPIGAKLVSTLVSTTSAYVMHRQWSFSHRARTGLRREYPAFALINGLTLLLSLGVVGLVHHGFGVDDAVLLQVANLASIGLGTIIRFLAYKRWVFPPAAPPTTDPSAAEPVRTDPGQPRDVPAGAGAERVKGGSRNPSATVADNSRNDCSVGSSSCVMSMMPPVTRCRSYGISTTALTRAKK
ncbi:MAG: GtrA family protein [Geodermatophilaceae bacterium]